MDTSSQGMLAYAAPSFFQPHRARDAVRDAYKGRIPPLLGYYAGLSSIPITRAVAPMNFDCVWIDWEHTACNVETMTTMVHETIFMSQGRTIPWVRVPGHDHANIGYALDAGASIIVPQVETVEQAKHVMASTKFGTRSNGNRSVPPFRLMPQLADMSLTPGRDLHQGLNDQAAVMIQIESLEGINNLDAILTEVPEIDIVWLGSVDARVSMNFPANLGVGDEPEWIQAREKFFEIAKKHDKPVGGHCFEVLRGTIQPLQKLAERLSFIIMTVDVFHLMKMEDDLKEARDLFRRPATRTETSDS
ncbi:hypothetical protein PFICI_08074 [Pestalotiopsis fici W106-1]|uniref:HpcH/HpaI aldolase/citrate lyase domain-containing protein n=1 Tax=Pestalotiopsis fici (strain W106-1 / CGMCC3.15140) TaxID=1229662 RepID=W3X388_PESFW|nr:uncharacterized protein PFICI_08074 [Pestalotiopsis fici W106-1]ETS80545.1 hypothetical protein PFICI_08074 [Pestalotiopsis fici W106-1]